MTEESVRLEHRLTKIEESQVALQGTANKILTRLDASNGAMVAHFKADEKWMGDHDIVHTKAKAYADGRASVRKGDLAMLLGAVTIATGLVNAAARFL